MYRYPHGAPDTGPADDSGGIEFLEDRTRPIAAGTRASRFGVSVPGAIAGAFLITAIAFGAAMRPADPTSATGSNDQPAAAANDADTGTDGDATALGHEGGDLTDATHDKNPGADAGPAVDEPRDEPAADEPKDQPAADQPKDQPVEPDPTKATPPAPAEMALALELDGGHIVVDWGACERDGFYAYKVVRSTDAKVAWPAGDNDSVRAIIEKVGTTAFTDSDVAKGKTYYYKVLAFATFEGVGYTACKTDVRGITIPAPESAAFGLTVKLVEGKVLVDWTACGIGGFDYYKVVRSKDATVTFPTGDADTLVAAVGPDGDDAAWDKEAPAGTTLYYRVFCVDKTEAGYSVLAATAVKSVTTPAAAPKPEPKPTPVPYSMGFSIAATGEGVVLDWEACGSDGFAFYKVVRSRGSNPSYFPGTDGTQIVAVAENSGTVHIVDNPPEGGTWFYRVQSIGYWGEQKVLLGQTPALSVALP